MIFGPLQKLVNWVKIFFNQLFYLISVAIFKVLKQIPTPKPSKDAIEISYKKYAETAMVSNKKIVINS